MSFRNLADTVKALESAHVCFVTPRILDERSNRIGSFKVEDTKALSKSHRVVDGNATREAHYAISTISGSLPGV